jgi:ATP-dependent DNA helicase RecQ
LLQLRHTTQALKDQGHTGALPDKVSRLVNSIASDGRNEDGGLERVMN